MKSIFIILEENDNKWGIYTHASSHYHSVRNGLCHKHAEGLARELNKMATTKLTNPNCPHCGGVGGCYLCDS